MYGVHTVTRHVDHGSRFPGSQGLPRWVATVALAWGWGELSYSGLVESGEGSALGRDTAQD